VGGPPTIFQERFLPSERRFFAHSSLTTWRIGAKLSDVFPEEVAAEAVDPHVGFGNGELLGGGDLLLDDVDGAPADSSDARRRAEMADTSSTAARNETSFFLDGLVKPLILRTN